MKHLIVFNGTMGVGKNATADALFRMLQPSAYLDGDWCWNLNPLIQSEENRQIVIGNIMHLLQSYLNSSSPNYVIFTWVMHLEEIWREIGSRLKLDDWVLHRFTLTCSKDALRRRLEKDIAAGMRDSAILERSIPRIDLYRTHETVKIHTDSCTAHQAVRQIRDLIIGFSPQL